MKIRKLTFQNINSLRGEHEIDFTAPPLANSPLFAITGPTGSGKSTLLDVISLALFSQVPRMGRITKTTVEKSGALLTRNTKSAYASVEYECHKGVFRSTWSISINSKGTLRDFDMELTNMDTLKNLDLKKREVPQANEAHIGLNYEQFIKSILLAQGEFAKFLQVSKADRAQLLERITGTSIYRALGKRAFEKFRDFGSALETLRTEQTLFKDNMLSADELEQVVSKIEGVKKQIAGTEQALEEAHKQLEVRGQWANLLKKLEDLADREALNLENETAFKIKYGHALEAHERTLVFAEDLRAWYTKSESLGSTRGEEATLQRDSSLAAQALDDQLTEVKVLVHDASLTQERVVDALFSFQEKIEGFDRELNGHQTQIERSKDRLELLAKHAGLTLPKGDADAVWRAFEDLKAQLGKELEPLQSQLTLAPDDALPELIEDARAQAQLFNLGKATYDQWIEQGQTLIIWEKELEDHKAQFTALPKLLETAEIEEESARTALKTARLEWENFQLRASLEEHRKRLESGVPCPLCGSLEHPLSNHQPSSKSALQTAVAQCEERWTTANKEVLRLAGILRDTERNMQKMQTDSEELKSKVQTLYSRLEKQFEPHWLKVDADWNREINRLNERATRLERADKLQSQLEGIKACSEPLKHWKDAAAKYQELHGERATWFEGANIASVCESARSKWAAALGQLTAKTQALKEKRKQAEEEANALANLEKLLIPKVEAQGFSSVSEAWSKRLPEAEFEALRKQRETIEREKAGLEVERSGLQKDQSDLEAKLTKDDDQSLAEAVETMADRLSAEREVLLELETNKRTHFSNAQGYEQTAKKIAEAADQGRKWELLKTVIGDGNGKRFNDFAQDLTLEQLLVLANKRLVGLSDRYQLASAQEGEDAEHLYAVDQHMGNLRRSVKTLSGGETFLMSLSLALALSDLASRKVEINSLFIDEGFGTLDPETLDQTIDTLERLQSESGKTVGVISHVESLKERITTQIKLDRNGQGYSTLQIL